MSATPALSLGGAESPGTSLAAPHGVDWLLGCQRIILPESALGASSAPDLQRR